jgi:ABC-type nitrate/sulfonate/bicarbonate transport system permease component
VRRRIGPAALRALRALARIVAFTALSLAITALLWQVTIKALHLDPYFAKGPLDVFDYLFRSPESAMSRAVLWDALLVTLRDAALGFFAGSLAALGVAVAVVLRRGVAQTVMPLALALRSVPLVAMTPLITLMFGQGLFTVALVAGVVTFFPSFALITAGLRAVPPQSFDLFRAYGASEATVLRRLQLPYAFPALFTAARIAAPGALLGAILAEWLATGKGLGYIMVTSSSTSQYALLWSTIVLITVVSILIYNLVSALERGFALRLGLPNNR